jgi:hypothetical protein
MIASSAGPCLHRECDRDNTGWQVPARFEANMLTILVTIYVIACLFTALFGRQRRMGYIGTFLISLLITPVLMLLVLALTGPAPQIEWRRRPDQQPGE